MRSGGGSGHTRPPVTDLKLENCINEVCPWSGKPVSADSLTLYKGTVVGFCNVDCRDKFKQAVNQFDGALASRQVR